MNVFLRALVVSGPRMWGLLLAGPAISAMLAGMVLILWLGGWSDASEHQRLWYLGMIALLLSADLAVVITALAAAKVSLRGPGDIHIDADATGSTKITTETTVTGAPNGSH